MKNHEIRNRLKRERRGLMLLGIIALCTGLLAIALATVLFDWRAGLVAFTACYAGWTLQYVKLMMRALMFIQWRNEEIERGELREVEEMER